MQFPLLPAHVINGYCIRQYRYRIFPSSQKVHQWSNSCIDLYSSTKCLSKHNSSWVNAVIRMCKHAFNLHIPFLYSAKHWKNLHLWFCLGCWGVSESIQARSDTMGQLLWMLSVACPHLCLFFMTSLCSDHLPTVSVPICFPKAFFWCCYEHSACTLGKPKVPRY